MRAVVATNIRTGEETAFTSISDAARILHIDQGGIAACVDGKQRKSRGYTFRDARKREWSLTYRQAEIIMALANNGLVIERAKTALYSSSSAIRYHIQEIRENTGKDPLDFWDLIVLAARAKKLIALEEQCRKEKERRSVT